MTALRQVTIVGSNSDGLHVRANVGSNSDDLHLRVFLATKRSGFLSLENSFGARLTETRRNISDFSYFDDLTAWITVKN